MKRQPRLGRSEVLARLRDHAARFGAVSRASLDQREREVLRSVPLYFRSLDAACKAAGVPGAMRRPAARARRRSPSAVWSRRRVIDELRRLDRSGQSTRWGDLVEAGRGDLVGAAATYAGGLQRARAQAGVRRPERRMPVPQWNKASIVGAIQDRVRKRQTLASSKVPPRLVAAARWHFGSWEKALAAAGVDAQAVRLQRRPFTKAEIVEVVRRLARGGGAVRASALKGVVKLGTVRKLFGSVERAVRAAGVEYAHARPNQTWSRARVIEELRARSRRGEVTLTRGLHRAVQRYFGGAHAARKAAGVPALLRAPWTKASLIEELQRRARRGDAGSRLWAPCKRLFGSVRAARAAARVPATQRTKGMLAWSKVELLAELRRRARSRRQLGRGLTEGLRRQFGSLSAARAAARLPERKVRGGQTAPAVSNAVRRAVMRSRRAWRRWSRDQVLEKLRAWHAAGGGRLRGDLQLACVHHFGSAARAAAAADLPRRGIRWTPGRIQRALRTPGFDIAAPRFVAACIEHFGSVTAARASAAQRKRGWSKATVIAELQARAQRGLPGVGRLLRAAAVRLFGSTDAALRAAVQVEPRRRGAADAQRR
jgi:molybdenum-dependent DNA-binding transcriptional regulator ModE